MKHIRQEPPPRERPTYRSEAAAARKGFRARIKARGERQDQA